MSHFCVIVLVPWNVAREDVPERVERMLEPYCENGEWFRRRSRWDWFSIGGRWTGYLSGYRPLEDPANLETCWLCGGTGDRAGWMGEPKEHQHPSGCNGCLGKGQSIKWALNEHEGDIRPVRDLIRDWRPEHDPVAMVLPNGLWRERAIYGWFGSTRAQKCSRERWHEKVRRYLKANRPAWAVVVDCHV